MDRDEILEFLPPGLSAAERAEILRRLEILQEFAAAAHTPDRTADALGARRAARAARARLAFNPGPARVRALVPAEARRWQRLERRLRARLAAPPPLDSATRAAAAAWLGSVHGGQALATASSRRYWRDVCEHKIRMARAQAPGFWHACRVLVSAADAAAEVA